MTTDRTYGKRWKHERAVRDYLVRERGLSFRAATAALEDYATTISADWKEDRTPRHTAETICALLAGRTTRERRAVAGE